MARSSNIEYLWGFFFFDWQEAPGIKDNDDDIEG